MLTLDLAVGIFVTLFNMIFSSCFISTSFHVPSVLYEQQNKYKLDIKNKIKYETDEIVFLWNTISYGNGIVSVINGQTKWPTAKLKEYH